MRTIVVTRLFSVGLVVAALALGGCSGPGIASGGVATPTGQLPSPAAAASPTATPTATEEPGGAPPTPTPEPTADVPDDDATPTPTPPPTPTPTPENAAPVAVFTEPPVGVVGPMEWIKYTLSDEESDFGSVHVSYSTDGGATYYDATLADGYEPVDHLDTRPDGLPHQFVWDLVTDLGRSGAFDDLVIKLVPSDDKAGEAIVTEPFAYHPLREVVGDACDIRGGLWDDAFIAWETLRDALRACQSDMLVVLESDIGRLKALVEDPPPPPPDADPEDMPDPLEYEPPDINPIWDVFWLLEKEVKDMDRAIIRATTVSELAPLGESAATIITLGLDLEDELMRLGSGDQVTNKGLHNVLNKMDPTVESLPDVAKTLQETALVITRMTEPGS